MAEQVSHNVVNSTESASASASADVIASNNIGIIAGGGTNSSDSSTFKAAREDVKTTSAITTSETTTNDPPDPQSKPGTPNCTQETLESDGSVGINSDIEKKEGSSHHNRTSSVKKPTTFSKVSVTKNFLAKTASPTPVTSKIGDKPSPLGVAAQPATTAKPRLVAKTGALQSMQKARAGTDSVSGPDASKVWNKNRPAPPQPPKQFTDEELKQQYGIHLATRLQTDEGGKESKWADIDDDEEDWAPETVVWMDGTKSTLTPADATPVPKEQPPSESTGDAKALEPVKPSLAIKKSTETGPPRTILKPGIAAQQSKQQNGSSGGSTTSEKPSLKVKTPAPTPAKSPWAQLPPVSAVSPVNPPVQQPPQQSRLPTQDARAYEEGPSQPPTREIAADTFDRSWREGEDDAPRELFNSTNGRYEPAPEGRRSSIRPESHRNPLLLQRPSQSGSVPAEPSPAFQTRSTSQADGSTWVRRRGSSVSQGSLPPGRRTSLARSHELPPAPEDHKRNGTVAGHDLRGPSELARNESTQRLKAKLAALESAGKSRKEREAEAVAAATASKLATGEKPAKTVESRPAAPSQSSENPSGVAPLLEDKPVPPALAPQVPSDEMLSPVPPKSQPPAATDRPKSSGESEQQLQSSRARLSPKNNSRPSFGQQQYRSPLVSNDALQGWGSTAPNGNVWGTAGIGNGTFESTGSFAPMSQASLLPPPVTKKTSPSATDQSRMFPPPGIDPHAELGWGSARAAVSPRPPHAPGPIAPPSRAHQIQRSDPVTAWNSAAARFPHQYAADAVAAESKQQTESGPALPSNTVKETFKKTSLDQGHLGSRRRFNQTEYTIHDADGSRSVASLSPAPPSTQTQPVGPLPISSPLNEAHRHAGESTVRIPDGSLNPAHGGLLSKQPPIGPPNQTQSSSPAYQSNVHFPTGPLPNMPPIKEQSPPPPETDTHPVHDSQTHRPNVKLPAPPPRVRLPPGSAHSSSPMHQVPVMLPHQRPSAWGPPGVARPIAQTEDWQARFNGLFNRTSIHTEVPPSPPKTPPKTYAPALAVSASSRTVVEYHSAPISATVSLPQFITKHGRTPEGFIIDDSTDVFSKPTIEQMFNEELSHGSLPRVNISRNVIYDAKVCGSGQRNMLKMSPNSRFIRPIDPQTGIEMASNFFPKPHNGILVKILGTKLDNKLVSAHHRNSKTRGGDRRASARAKGAGKGSRANSEPHLRKASVQKPESSAAVGVLEAEQSGVKKRLPRMAHKSRMSSKTTAHP
ncbi:MAG: hypothetical protein FE78DRAFT_250133 [Acidomyces sp. 'richmondensis']|nr:MAG: hypothetical protein FE78DRAFT_250133 [Acidomyces sp. 'richmondensis']